MKRVLLIEDDRDIVELVRYNLEREGFQVSAANDGATGLVQVRKTPPDMLLLDLTLPNRVFTRDQLLDAVWGTERFVTPRSVDVYIRRLREKVECDADHPAFLKTVRGAGYMFESAAQSKEEV